VTTRYRTLIPEHGPSRIFAGPVLIPPQEHSRHVDFLADLGGRHAEEEGAIALAEQIARERRQAAAALSAPLAKPA
jgi:hypothetical protein